MKIVRLSTYAKREKSELDELRAEVELLREEVKRMSHIHLRTLGELKKYKDDLKCQNSSSSED